MTVEETISDLIWLLGSNLLDEGSEDTVLNAIYYLENQPSRKGHWIRVSKEELSSDDYLDLNLPWYKCSECGEIQLVVIPRECKFCRKCGADMREDTNDSN